MNDDFSIYENATQLAARCSKTCECAGFVSIEGMSGFLKTTVAPELRRTFNWSPCSGLYVRDSPCGAYGSSAGGLKPN